MIIDVEHETRYAYDRPVTLECQTLRMRPREDGTQRLLAFDLAIVPQESERADGRDLDGNAIVQTWFGGPVTRFEVTMRARVETLLGNPYHFVLPRASSLLPVRYDAATRTALAACLGAPPAAEGPVERLAAEAAADAKGSVVALLARLAALVHERHRSVRRPEGRPWAPEETLARGEGACRDLAVLFVAAARAAGFAARFVSGYQIRAVDRAGHDLHAWAEVYLPGVGWKGFDPSEGLAVAQRHVPVAAGATPEGASPVAGTFLGGAVTSTLSARVAARVVG